MSRISSPIAVRPFAAPLSTSRPPSSVAEATPTGRASVTPPNNDGPPAPAWGAIDSPLPPPRAPEIALSGAHLRAAEAFAAEIADVVAMLPASANAGPPDGPHGPHGPHDSVPPLTQIAALVAHCDKIASGDLLCAFIKLRLRDRVVGLATHDALAELFSEVRQQHLEAQRRALLQAADHQADAMAETATLQTANQVVGVVSLVLTVSLATLTFGAGAGVLVTAAAGSGFAAGGLWAGRQGHAFDVQVGLAMANHGAEVSLLLLGLGSICALGSIPPSTGARLAAQAGSAGVQAVGKFGQAIITHRIAATLLDGEVSTLDAKYFSGQASLAQQEWKTVHQMLQAAAESHQQAAKTILDMLRSRHQTMQKAIGAMRR